MVNIYRRHLYTDLQPYVCLDTSCQHHDSTFSNRANWIQHLALDHGMEPSWEQIKCPLCTDEVGPGKIAITTHLGRHLEEISLSALPAAPDSETNSETSDSDTKNIQEGNQQPLDMLQQLQFVEVASEEEGWARWGEVRADPATSSAPGDQTPVYSHNPPLPSSIFIPSHTPFKEYVQASALERQVQGDNAIQQEKRKRALQPSHDPEHQTHNDKEASWYRRTWVIQEMAQTRIAQEGQKREIEEGSFEAEETAYGRPEAEQKAEEDERARLYTQAMASKAAVEEATHKRIQAQRAEEDQLRTHWKTRQVIRNTGKKGQERTDAEAKAWMLDIEEAALHRTKDMKAFQEETKREIEYPNKNALRRNDNTAEFDPVAFTSNVRRGIEAFDSLSQDPEQPSDTDEFYSTIGSHPLLQIENSRSEAQKAARQRSEAEQNVEEERAKNLTEAMATPEEKANLGFQAELKAAEARRRAKAKARYEANVDTWIDFAFEAANEKQAQEHFETAVVPNGPRHEGSDTNTRFEYNERVDAMWRWPWICPSCGSKDQDRRKGPVCSNCSYLIGDSLC